MTDNQLQEAKSNFHHGGKTNSSPYDQDKALKAKSSKELDELIKKYGTESSTIMKAYIAKAKAERARRVGIKEDTKSNFHHGGKTNSSPYDQDKALKAKSSKELDELIKKYGTESSTIMKAYIAKAKAERARRVGIKEDIKPTNLITELLSFLEFETPGLKLGALKLDTQDNCIYVTIGGQKYKYTPNVADKANEVYASVTGMAKHSTGRALAFLKKNATGEKLNEAFSSDDIAINGTVIYKDRDGKCHQMSKAASKTGNKVKLHNGKTIDNGDVVSTDLSDWNNLKNLKLKEELEELEEKVFPENHYTWFEVTAPMVNLERRGKIEHIAKGQEIGLRRATSSTDKYRVVTKKLGPTIIFSLDHAEFDQLTKQMKRLKGSL